MKLSPLYLSFLDLVFATLAASTILNVILALTAGRAQHQLSEDYILVEVEWRGGEPVEYDRCTLTSARGIKSPGWTFQQYPASGSVDQSAARHTSTYYKAPVPGGEWRLVLPDELAGRAKRVTVTSKRGSRVFLGGRTEILIETKSNR